MNPFYAHQKKEGRRYLETDFGIEEIPLEVDKHSTWTTRNTLDKRFHSNLPVFLWIDFIKLAHMDEYMDYTL